MAVEETFVNKDAQATLKLGQARAMSLLVPALHNLPVAEYGANQVKKTVVGVGHADKDQVQAMVKILLPKADSRRPTRPTPLPSPSPMPTTARPALWRRAFDLLQKAERHPGRREPIRDRV